MRMLNLMQMLILMLSILHIEDIVEELLFCDTTLRFVDLITLPTHIDHTDLADIILLRADIRIEV